MPASDPLSDYVCDVLADFDEVVARRMFGGVGLYCGAVMIGLADGDALYLKADDVNRPQFEAAGSTPFTYRRAGRKSPVVMSYWRVPLDVLEDRTRLRAWARLACAAAERNAARSRPRHPRRRPRAALAPAPGKPGKRGGAR